LSALNLISTIGVYILAVGIAISFWNLYRCRTSGVLAGPNPWGAASLEWITSSPPEPFNFARIPLVSSRSPLWDGEFTAGPTLDGGRLTPVTTVVEATPENPVELPVDNVWSVVIAVGLVVAFAALLVRWYWLGAAGTAFSLFCLARWMWPARIAAMP
jgi:hypothetical protein